MTALLDTLKKQFAMAKAISEANQIIKNIEKQIKSKEKISITIPQKRMIEGIVKEMENQQKIVEEQQLHPMQKQMLVNQLETTKYQLNSFLERLIWDTKDKLYYVGPEKEFKFIEK